MDTVMAQTHRVVIGPVLAARRRASEVSWTAMTKLIATLAQRGASIPQNLTDQYLTAYRELAAVDAQIRAEYVAPLEGEETTAAWTINAAAGTIDVTLKPKAVTAAAGPDLKERYLEELETFRAGYEDEVTHYRELYALRKSGATPDEELAWQLQRAEARHQADQERMDQWLAAMVRAGYGTEADYTALTGKPFPAETEAANG